MFERPDKPVNSTNFARILITFLVLLAATTIPVSAQINTNLSISDNLQIQKEEARMIRQKYRELKKLNKENTRHEYNQIIAFLDSLQKKYKTEKELSLYLQQQENDAVDLTDSELRAIRYLKKYPLLEKNKISRSNLKKYIKEEWDKRLINYSADEEIKDLITDTGKLPDDTLFQNLSQFDKLNSFKPDSSFGQTIDQQIDNLAAATSEFHALQQESSKTSALPFESLTDHPLSKARQAGIKFFEKEDLKVNEAIAVLDQYKEKYRYIRNSAEINKEEAKDTINQKINSLQGEPFRKRLQWSGNFHLEAGKPLVIDFSPGVAYRFDRNWSIGIACMIRSRFDRLTRHSIPAKGFQAYTEYRIWKSFSLYGEYEYLMRSKTDGETSSEKIKSGQSINAGLSKSFGLFKGLKGKAMVLYNVEMNGGRFYETPWVVRVGVER